MYVYLYFHASLSNKVADFDLSGESNIYKIKCISKDITKQILPNPLSNFPCNIFTSIRERAHRSSHYPFAQLRTTTKGIGPDELQ